MFDVLDRRPVAQSAVRPDLVVIPSPELDLLPRICEIGKPVLGEALVAEASVEALRVRVFDGDLNRLFFIVSSTLSRRAGTSAGTILGVQITAIATLAKTPRSVSHK